MPPRGDPQGPAGDGRVRDHRPVWGRWRSAHPPQGAALGGAGRGEQTTGVRDGRPRIGGGGVVVIRRVEAWRAACLLQSSRAGCRVRPLTLLGVRRAGLSASAREPQGGPRRLGGCGNGWGAAASTLGPYRALCLFCSSLSWTVTWFSKEVFGCWVFVGIGITRHVDNWRKMEALKLTVNKTYYFRPLPVSGPVLVYIHCHLVYTLVCEVGRVSPIYTWGTWGLTK